MTVGQNFRFGFYDVSPQERLKAIRRAGFDATMFWWGEEYEETDGNRYELMAAAKRVGLAVNTLHFPAYHADYLWREERAKGYVDDMIAALYDCEKYGVENLVMHTTRKLITPPYNENGLNELSRAVKVAEKVGVNIAVENTRFPEYNRYIYENLPSSRLTFCYDSGHENTFTHGRDVLSEFGSRLTTSHLHDNDSSADQHLMIGEGTINFAPVFSKLKAFGLKNYNLECYCSERSRYFGKVSVDEYLSLAHKALMEEMEKAEILSRETALE